MGRTLAWACETWNRWEQDVDDEGKTFMVRLITPQDPRLKTTFGYSCDCPAFRKEPWPCIHVLIAQGNHCGWHEKFSAEKVTEAGKCPRCGGKLVQVPYVE